MVGSIEGKKEVRDGDERQLGTEGMRKGRGHEGGHL